MKDRQKSPTAAESIAATSVEKRIAAVRNKMIGTVVIILALGIWQNHFVMEGIAAHMEITLTILGTFAFSTVLAFVFVAKLKNEVVAFKALREMWDDIQHGNTRRSHSPAGRLERCHSPAQVFQRPRLLGHAYELVTEELARTKKIRVSVETMNTLVHSVESSINDEKSLITYLSGLLVFMGLIGTFIGLLHMVGSIGGIIGSLAGSASGSDSSGAFGELLSALQEPLKGMASGFAASLFGLFSSLVVGLLGRFAGQAAGVLKSEFEGWLASVVQIGSEEEEASAQHGALPAGATVSGGALQDPALLRMVGNILGDYTRVAGQFDQVAQSMQALQAQQARQSEIIATMGQQVGRLESGQHAMAESVARVASEQGEVLAARFEAIAREVLGGVGGDQMMLRDALQEMNRQHGNNLRLLTANQHQTATRLSEALEMVTADIARRAEAETMRGGDAVALEAAARALEGFEARHGVRLTALEQDLARLAQSQEALTRVLSEELPPRLVTPVAGQGTDAGVADSLDRINHTMDSALSAYSGLLHVALAALERADRKGADTDEAAARTGTAS